MEIWNTVHTPVTLLLAGLAYWGCAKSGPKMTLAGDDLAPGPIAWNIHPKQHAVFSPRLLERGESLYRRNCAACHGDSGDGNGPAAYLLYPKPRDFTRGEFRPVSTWEGLPTDEDLFTTISRGMPGSSMPPWGHLAEEDRWALVHYVKSYYEDGFEIAGEESVGSEGIISVPEEPGDLAQKAKYSAGLYQEGCAQCHGSDGRGDGVEVQEDSRGFPVTPRDFTLGIFKGSPEPERLYRRILAGMPGSPMPMSQWAHGKDAWYLTRYILSLSTAQQRAVAEMRRCRVAARKVGEASAKPDADLWNRLPGVEIPLMPLWWRGDHVKRVRVRAAHDGRRLALHLSREDPTLDDQALGQHSFTDAAALQFTEEADPPLFAMGTAAEPVNIWQWKASWERDSDSGYPRLAARYPHMYEDGSPGLAQPDGYAAARMAGNPISATKHASPAEDLNAAGFGTSSPS